MKDLVQNYQALGDENRLRILNLLVSKGELCVCDIQRVLDAPQARVSRHLAYLKNTRWVEDRRQGLWMMYKISNSLNDIQKLEIEIMRKKFPKIDQFREDLKVLEKMTAKKTLACCTAE